MSKFGPIAITVVAGIWSTLPAAADTADAQAGKQLFEQKCVACHTLGKGDLVGPDLAGVTGKVPRAWLERWIRAPDVMIAGKDPRAMSLLREFHEVPMPNQGLDATGVAAILAYLETVAPNTEGSSGVSRAAASAPAVAGSPEIGKELFMGAARFRNGGPPCMACHSVSGIGALGGGQLGPDLTDVISRYGGPAALMAFVGGSPTPTMNAVWARTPLTAEERASVVAFLAEATVNRRPQQAIWQLAGLSLLGVALLLAAAGWLWRQRTADGVRRPMIARQRRASLLDEPAHEPGRH